jgi:hypothetical protein
VSTLPASDWAHHTLYRLIPQVCKPKKHSHTPVAITSFTSMRIYSIGRQAFHRARAYHSSTTLFFFFFFFFPSCSFYLCHTRNPSASTDGLTD